MGSNIGNNPKRKLCEFFYESQLVLKIIVNILRNCFVWSTPSWFEFNKSMSKVYKDCLGQFRGISVVSDWMNVACNTAWIVVGTRKDVFNVHDENTMLVFCRFLNN